MNLRRYWAQYTAALLMYADFVYYAVTQRWALSIYFLGIALFISGVLWKVRCVHEFLKTGEYKRDMGMTRVYVERCHKCGKRRERVVK